MSSTTASSTIDVLRHLFSRYGLPEQLVSDNGPQFSSDQFELFMRQNGIKHYRSAPYHPATNGAVERFVKTFKQAIKTGKMSRKPTCEVLCDFLLRYRSTPHAVTGLSPAELFLNRIVLDLLRPSLNKSVSDNQEKQKYYFDRHWFGRGSNGSGLQEGDTTLVTRIYQGVSGSKNVFSVIE